LSEAQQAAALLEPRINALYQILQHGEADRDKETVMRWQAGYDLAMGRTLAIKVRTETYNAMLAAANEALQRVLSGDSQAFNAAVRQEGGQ